MDIINLPLHPLQSSQWGEFRKKTGVKVVPISDGFQMTIHPIPHLPYTIGYLPKCALPDKEIVNKLIAIGKQKQCIFIKLEPNVLKSEFPFTVYRLPFTQSSHPLFTKYSFHLDLTKSEEELLANMKSKTRYNIKVAQKHGVMVVEDNSNQAFETYLKLSEETWKRQKFYGHTKKYHRLMWQTLHPARFDSARQAGIAHLLIAYYSPSDQPKTDNRQLITDKRIPLAAWILFLYNNVLYYPYGASSTEHKETMASNLMMWEAIKWGKAQGAKLFDLWGCLGPNPDENDPWYGFHRFKEGYGGKLVEFVGSYDVVIHPIAYKLYSLIHPIRQLLLQVKR